MGNPVVHFEIIGKDAQALQSFYQQAFAWQIDPPTGPANYGLARPQAECGIDGGIGATEDYAGHVTFYVAVPDITAAFDKIESLGGKRVMGPDEVPNGPTIGLFADPEGHTVGLVQAQS